MIHGVNATIADGEFIVIVGPSGCGKSTLLRMIAGLETITEGEISIAGRVVNNVEPKDRDIAMVFQNYALYPHMSVYDNMAFGLKMRKFPKAEIEQRRRGLRRHLGSPGRGGEPPEGLRHDPVDPVVDPAVPGGRLVGDGVGGEVVALGLQVRAAGSLTSDLSFSWRNVAGGCARRS